MFFKDNPGDLAKDIRSQINESLLSPDEREREQAQTLDQMLKSHGASAACEGGKIEVENVDGDDDDAARQPDGDNIDVSANFTQSARERKRQSESPFITTGFFEHVGMDEEVSDDKFDERAATIFEPRNFSQKMNALWQNCFEVAFLLVLFIAARFNPSIISLVVVFISTNMMIPISLSNFDRILWGRVLNFLNLIAICTGLFYKMSYHDKYVFDDLHTANLAYKWAVSCGFLMKNLAGPIESEDQPGKWEFNMKVKDSCDFEYVSLMISLLAFSQYQFMHQAISKLHKQKYREEVLLLQNFEISQTYKSEMDKERKKEEVPDNMKTDQELQRDKKNAILKQQYKKEMANLSDKFPKNFIDCRWFQKMNKSFFIMTLVCQLIQSMGYNGIFDIPQLLMILALFSFFAYRKSMPMTFGILTMFFIYYISYAILIKWLYLISIDIPFIRDWIRGNPKDTIVKICQALFGDSIEKVAQFKANSDKDQNNFNLLLVESSSYQLSVIGTFFFSKTWQSAKWCTIREKTQVLQDNTSSWLRFKFFIKFSHLIATKDQRLEMHVKHLKTQRKGNTLLARQTEKIKNKFQAFQGNLISNFKDNANKYLPTMCIWGLRIGLTFQAYMYHSAIGLFHLAFVLFTFLSNTRFSLMVSTYLILPIYFMEFCVVYAMKIKTVNDNEFFQITKAIFLSKFHNPILEQVLYFSILALLFLSISCLKLCFMTQNFGYVPSSNDAIVELFYKKFTENDTYIIWKFFFQFARYLHVIVLAYLYIMSSRDLDNMRALVFMMFFIFYTASETLYRKTKWLLSFYLCYLIVNNYYYSLILPFRIDEITPFQLYKLKWYNLIGQNPIKDQIWKKDSSIYFRHRPDAFNWDVLILMVLLDVINKIFLDEKLAQEIQQKSWKILNTSYPETMKFVEKMQNILTSYMTFILVCLAIYYISVSETTLINWIFFALNILNLCFLSNNDGKKTTLKHSLRIAKSIVIYSAFIMISECLFAWFFGVRSHATTGSNDKWLKDSFPNIYDGLQLIGLRRYIRINEEDTKQASLLFFKAKCDSYIIFLLIGLYFASKYRQQLKKTEDLHNLTEEDFKRIFEFHWDHLKSKDQFENYGMQSSIFGGMKSMMESMSVNEPSKTDNQDKQDGSTADAKKQKKKQQPKKQDQTDNLLIMKIRDKSQLLDIHDFEMFYLMFQYDPGFLAYKYMKYWPLYDFISTYGHLFTNLLIIVISTNYVVNLYMYLNVCLICFMYAKTTLKIANVANDYFQQGAIQSQIDCKMASLISKKYQRGAFYQFTQIRKKVWKCQLILLVFVCILGFPTTLLSQARHKLAHDPQHKNAIPIGKIDKCSFYLFYIGIWKDPRSSVRWDFYGVIIAISFCLLFERMMITWLFTRNGCTYNRFQKFIELELRYQCVEKQIQPPKYRPYRYQNHYFDQDFKELFRRFQESSQQSKDRENMFRDKGIFEVRNFIPYKVAMRIKEAISFSFKIDGRSMDLNIDVRTLEMLNEWDKYCFMESKLKAEVDPEHLLQIKQMERTSIVEFLQYQITQNDDPKFIEQYGQEYEEYDLLKDHKIKMLQVQIEQAISRKYRISFAKGFRIFYEQIILFIVMILMLIKANVYSFIYLAFVIKYMRVTSKLILLQKLTRMICLIMLLQYFLYLTNMISNLSPMKLPAQFNNYPIVHHQENYAGPYLIPLLYQTKHFHDLKFAYLLGLPVSKYQMNELLLDFVLLFLVSNYVFLYQSPVLDPIVKKVFFCFPTMFESKEKWKRVAHVEKKVNRYGASGSGQQNDSAADDDEKNESKKESQDEVGYYDHVQSQVQWLRDPYLPPKKKFLEKGYTEEDFKLAYKQFAFACDYSNRNNPLDHEFDEEMDYMHEQAEEDKQDANAKQNEKALSDIDSVNSSILGEQKAPRHYYSEIGSKQLAEVCERNLNYYFINYCELKFNEIWSDDNLRERKWEMKQRDFYFRLVKQGSMLVYLTSHIFVLFVILLMATIRQSIIGFIYIGFITYCFLRTKSYAGAVLTQRENNQRQLYSNASEEHKKLKEEYQKYQNDLNQKKIKNYEIVQIMKKIQRLTPRIKQLEKQLKKYKTNIKDQKGNYESQEASEQWGIKDLIGKYLLFISTIDLTATVIFQLPTIRGSSIRRGLGLMKIWKLPDASIEYPFTYEGMVRASLTQHINGFRFESVHFWTLLITCFMIVLITFQTEIYNSTGYLKFVTQTDGSMDLLVSLSKLKQKGLAYMKNNSKIKKILQIQQKKKQLIATIDRFKAKLKRWRLFQKTTMDPMYGQNASAEDYAAGMKINDQPFSTPKNSKMRGRLLTGQKDDDEDEDEQVKFWKKLHQKKNKVSREEAEKIFENLADEFVKSKKSKLNRCARCYLCLNKCCVNNIMLKNDKATLEEIVKSQAEGSTETPSELEKIMKSEAKYMVRKFYDKQSGNQELYLLLKKSQMMGSKHSILSLTKFDKKIKLTQLESTWAFTRYSSMLMKYIELFFYIPITNTDTFIYIFMMYSMYQNAGLMSIIYPISIFGYALIEETRPGKRFWDFIRIYTMFILLLKMFFNLSWLNSFIRTDTFKYFHGMVRLGLEEQESTWDIIIYMMPEMLIISFIMVNEIMLRLNGVYDRNEIVFETVYDSIERWKAGGDEEKQREALKQQQHMDMAKYFTTYDDQKELIDQLENEQKLLEANTLYQDEEEEEKDKLTSEEQMELILKEYSTQIDMGANNFDLDGTGAESKNSFFDKMIQSKLLNKALENDTLYYFEGQRYICKKNKETFDPVEINEELEDNAIHETVSEGEHEADMDEKIELHLSHEEKTKPDIFERSQYLQTVFPSLKIQKPGYDYYGLTTFVLMILSIFVLIGFDKVNVSQADVLGKVGSQGDIFTTQTSLALLLTMMLIILERYINRANVMKAEDQPMNKIQDIKQGAQQAFQQQLRTRSMTTSMTMSQTQTMKTMKTTDFNASQSDSKALLDRMFGDEDDEHNEEITQERTKINDKQKLKFIVHWTLMISVHLAIFWIIPIRGNKTLYNGLPYCEPRDKKQFPYGCKNFHDNLYLKIFYFLFCCYFTLSGLQIRYGLPIWKKASSICHYMDYDSWEGQLCFIGAQLYSAIPFAIELRCLFDFVFTKTALDVFQFWQLFNYQFELYKAHFGNQSYVIKVMGVPITTEDYILGVFFLIIIIVMIIGPFYFFSEFSTFSTENPVRSASITVSLIVNKTLSIKDLVDRMVPKQNAPPLKDPYIDIDPIDETYRRKIQGQNESTNLFIDKNHKELFEEPNLNTSVPFDVYTVENPNMRFSPKDQDYSKWTETKFFKPTQMQEVISTEYPDKKWTIDHLNRDFLQIDINNTIIRQKPGFSISLEVKSDFVRDNPPQAKVSQNLQFKSLNYSQLDDCITGQQLLKFANFDCSDPKHDINDKVLIPWTQAYNQYLILGQTSTSVPIIRKVFEVQGEINSTTENGTTYWKEPWIVQNETLVDMNQKFDLLMEFRCPNIWLIRMSKKHTEFQDWEMDQDLRAVDPTTCVPLTRNQTYLDYLDFKGELIGHLGSDGKLVPNKNYKAKQDDQTRWTRLQFVLFSMLVSSGFFASYTVGAFYTVFLYGISPMVRLNLICPTFTAFLYDLTDATMMMKLFEACYMYRHEQDLYHEEETYRMIQEIIRSPGLFKLLTGTNLRGSIDPKNDFLNAEMIAKIKRLELLQQKGFDISAIQEKILRDNEEKMMEITKNEKKKNKK